MIRLWRPLLLTFVMSLSLTPAQRGVYFFAKARLGFTDTQNLLLALVAGATYVIGAICSHRLARRFSERTVVTGIISVVIALMCVLFRWYSVAVLYVGLSVLGFLLGAIWPVVESYVAAGFAPPEQAKAVGWFNIAWAASLPIGVAASGPIIHAFGSGLFLFAAGACVVALALAWTLPRRPMHLAVDDPKRFDAAKTADWRALLTAARFLMMSTYALMWVLTALFPGIFQQLGYSVATATLLACLLDVVRLVAFVALKLFPAWHGKSRWLVAAMVAIPLGFFLAVPGTSLATVLIGEMIFGLAIGVVYYSSLYYAMVVKNASVDAGGSHEGLIGAGLTVGPLSGLAAQALTPLLGGVVLLGQLAGVGPLVAVSTVLAARSLMKRRRPYTSP